MSSRALHFAFLVLFVFLFFSILVFFSGAAARFIFPFLSFSRSFQAQASNPKPQTRTPNPSLCSLDRFTVSPFDELRPLLLYSYLLVRCVLFACPLLLLGRCMPGREEFCDRSGGAGAGSFRFFCIQQGSSELQRGRVTAFSCDGVYARVCERV